MQKRPIHLKFFINHSATPEVPFCAHEGCARKGVYKAPKDYALQEHIWLCLEHVRAHNASWNYGGNKSYAAINQMREEALTWERKTKPMQGQNVFDDMGDPFDLFQEDASYKPVENVCTPTKQALATLGFDKSINMHSLKSRYRDLVKEHHPDKNGGCKKSEERLKNINAAYTFLVMKLTANAA